MSAKKTFYLRQLKRVSRYRVRCNRRQAMILRQTRQSRGALGFKREAMTDPMKVCQEIRLKRVREKYMWDDRNKKTVRRT